MHAAPSTCFHCGEALAGRPPLWMRLGDADVAVCCPGCRAAAQMICGLGLEDFYKFRSEPASKPPDLTDEWLAYDTPSVMASLTRQEADGRSIVLLIDGLTCAACSWLLTQVLHKIDGVARASVNTATGRAQIVWNPEKVALSHLLRVVASLGYRPNALTGETSHQQAQNERHAIMKRLAVSGLGMMQVMMFAVALYAADMQGGMEPDVRAFLRLVSMMVSTPVMLYAGWPFFVGAVRALRMRSVTMDVPVSLGLMLAFGASILNTWRKSGDVYFDSVTMFIFFLTVARYVEMLARHKSASVTDSLGRLLPVTAHRIVASEAGETIADVAVARLEIADRLMVRAGEIVPADGEIILGSSRVDESMLTGESLPVTRAVGDRIAAGTINIDAPVQMRVSATGSSTALASIVALLNKAQAERPRITREADQTASRFLGKVLAGAVLVCAVWLFVDPGRAFAATLAVLVVACPCALSLATLVAVASANAALARRGVLVTHADAIEGLAKVTRVVFDKTGTLTHGAVSMTDIELLGPRSAGHCLAIAAALEAASEHPIAKAFATPAGESIAEQIRVIPGAGVEGCVNGTRFRIGTRAFALASSDAAGVPAAGAPVVVDDAAIVLSDSHGALAAFTLADALRPESAATVSALARRGLATEILSGDSLSAVRGIALQCGIGEFSARKSPADKLKRIQTLTASGEFVAMVGDGINDAPVLGGSGVSIAMGRGSALALASADIILVGDSLRALPAAFEVAARAKTVIKQNLVWAAGYNLTAMPLAACGWVRPWAAAIGMSLSSILVVLNSMRLMRGAPSAHMAGATGAGPAPAAPGTLHPSYSRSTP
jgi:P-type Cu2+ transporter